MPITAFSHYNLRASGDVMEELRDFYTNVVGMREGDRPPFKSNGYWLYIGEVPVLHLVESSPGESCTPHVTNTFDHVAISATDIEGMQSLLREAGVEFERREVPLLGHQQLFLKDPAGNGVEFIFDQE